MAFGDILDKFHMLESHMKASGQKEEGFYRGFFTFDTTKTVKHDVGIAEAAVRYGNDEWFHLLMDMLLKFLMEGDFCNMQDVVSNPLREKAGANRHGKESAELKVDLNQRGKMIEGFFGIAHGTQVRYSKKYHELRTSITGEASF